MTISIPDPYRLVGTTLAGKYRLDEFAGTGGMGIVYKSLHNDLNQPVAIKILKPDVVFRNPETARLFQQEVETIKHLDHPHIVKVFDSGRDEHDLSFMVMEWLHGQTLEDLIHRGRVPVDRVVRLFNQICSALNYAHRQKVIHLDIKPANIFLLDNPAEDVIKVIDFGLARVIKSDTGTSVTLFRGTLQYCSPEHFAGKVSNRSDIYSLGATLYHCLAGVLPFGGSYIYAKMHQPQELPPIPSILKIRPEINSKIDQVLNKALSRNPGDRYQTVDEFYSDFVAASKVAETSTKGNTNSPDTEALPTKPADPGQAVLHHPVPQPVVESSWSPARKILALTLAGIIIIIGLLVWPLVIPLHRENDEGTISPSNGDTPAGTAGSTPPSVLAVPAGEGASPSTPIINTSLTPLISRFAPVEISADTSGLPAGDQQALAKIIQASRLMDSIFRRQVWSGNVALEQKLKADLSPEGRDRLSYFLINAGPWSRLDNNKPFISDVPYEKPPQAGFYPSDLTRQEFNAWVKTLSDADRKRAEDFFTTIRRSPSGKLKAVSYDQEYREFLVPAAKLLREAARLTTNRSLQRFLSLRAEAFISNDYFASDVAWMDLDAPIDLTIGPYETYEDELLGYKAAFEAFVALRDEKESDKLVKFNGYLQELENNLPIEVRYRNPRVGINSPIRVVNVVFTSGDGNRGVQTAAFNLPNIEQVIKEKGSKRIMIRNMQEAKFNRSLIPISKILLTPQQQSQVTFDAFFTHVLAHELMHGLGPHRITVDGKETSVRMQLKELYSAIEEAKADIMGLWALQYLIDKDVIDIQMEPALYTTYLASAFRSVRFGVTDAHGIGQALQFNYLLDEGAIVVNEATGVFGINRQRMRDAVLKLTSTLLTLQAEGAYEKAKAMLGKYGVIRPVMQKALDRLGDVPVDIKPIFTLAQEPEKGPVRSMLAR